MGGRRIDLTSIMPRPKVYCGFVLGVCGIASFAAGQSDFVNWETPHVHPLELTPGGTRLLAVNTADNRLEVFTFSGNKLAHEGSVPVGLDPVSVRARSEWEAWVVNHVSDSVSLVDLVTLSVYRTIQTDDEPADVIFAGSPERAFVSCSQANTVLVMDPIHPSAEIRDLGLVLEEGGSASGPLPFTVRIPIEGEDPRMLAKSANGERVYLAVFQSGNRTTVLGGGNELVDMFPFNVVDDELSPYFEPSEEKIPGLNPPNPPPNDFDRFFPRQNPFAPQPPRASLIVRQDADGHWQDDNGRDWSILVDGSEASRSGRLSGWQLVDHDVAVIETDTLETRYASGLMNLCMALSVHPVTGRLTVVGTDATNEIRFEPVLRGTFLRVNYASISPNRLNRPSIADLNPHLVYTEKVEFEPLPPEMRERSIGDPRDIVWNADGSRGYISGMGSNNVVIVASSGVRTADEPIRVGEGPTGLAIDPARARLYVLNKFEATLSIVDLPNHQEIMPRVPLFDPTPPAIRIGRKHLYDTHRTSGLGQLSCASCHVDARSDRLGWDLGDPAGDMQDFEGNCNARANQDCPDWHPMKGPMTTQTLQDIIGQEPHHWRGDRAGLEDFAGAFHNLLGDDEPLPLSEMLEFEDFLATIHFPPNPFRNFDNSLPENLRLPGHFSSGRFVGTGGLAAGSPLPNGNAVRGLARFRGLSEEGELACVRCHTLPTGLGPNGVFRHSLFQPLPLGPNGESHHAVSTGEGSTNRALKTPQLRDLYEKTGFEMTQERNTAGFGFLHDGSIDSLARFVNRFQGIRNDQDLADLVAFLLSLSGGELPQGEETNANRLPGSVGQDSHAAVGRQITLGKTPARGSEEAIRLGEMIRLASDGKVGLVAKGMRKGIPRGYTYVGLDVFQSDRAMEQLHAADLESTAGVGSEITYTVVPAGTEGRIGIDRDDDGFLDRDELDFCGDPADPESMPVSCPLHGDLVAASCVVNVDDVVYVLDAYGDPNPCATFPRADLIPCGRPCSLVDLSDILSVLSAYRGEYECINPCPRSPY